MPQKQMKKTTRLVVLLIILPIGLYLIVGSIRTSILRDYATDFYTAWNEANISWLYEQAWFTNWLENSAFSLFVENNVIILIIFYSLIAIMIIWLIANREKISNWLQGKKRSVKKGWEVFHE